MEPTNINQMDPEEWFTGLQYFLYNTILPLAEPDAKRRLKLIEQEPMETWLIVFTHKSIDPNAGANYEELEKLGDAVAAATFYEYLMKRIDGLTPKSLTLLKNHYLSKPEQAKFAIKIGLQKWLRVAYDLNTHIIEDLLEAFYGGLLTVGNKIRTSYGYALAMNFTINLFQNVTIDFDAIKADATTQIKEIFEKMGWVAQGAIKDIEDWRPNETGTSGTMYLIFPKKALDYFRYNQMSVPSDIIAVDENSTKKVAESKVFEKALERLKELGITQEWANIQRGSNEFMSSELAPYYPTALGRARREGYNVIYFASVKISSKGCVAQLIGQRPNHKLTVLVTVSLPGCNKGIDAKREALMIYGSGK